MLGELTNEQIDHVLHSQAIGRIGCYAKGAMYVVPVTYAYDGKCIYAHSKEGMKVKMMRENNQVCFEVDVIENMANWRSVIVWGTYEELKGKSSQQKVMKILATKMLATTKKINITPSKIFCPYDYCPIPLRKQ